MSQSEFPINLEMNSGWSMITETEKINRYQKITPYMYKYIMLRFNFLLCFNLFQPSLINYLKMEGESGASNLVQLIGVM